MFEAELVEQIVCLLENSSVEEVELYWKGKRLVIRRSSCPQKVVEEVKPREETLPASVEVTAQVVGFFYPSVKRGEIVKEGEKLGEVETLGIRDEVLAPVEGIVENLLGEGEIVEYGKIICLIKPQEVETS